MPLGTGNDLSLTFGWGNAFLPLWVIKVLQPCTLISRHAHCLQLTLLHGTHFIAHRQACSPSQQGAQQSSQCEAVAAWLSQSRLSVSSGAQEHRAVYDTLARIAQAEPRMLDVWRVSFSASAPPCRACSVSAELRLTLGLDLGRCISCKLLLISCWRGWQGSAHVAACLVAG